MKKILYTQKKSSSKKIFGFLIILLISLQSYSQSNIGINSTGLPPNASAGLDVDFPNKGILIPRVSLTSTSSFAPLLAHVAGMIVYNTATIADVVPGFYYDNGTKWIQGFLTGNAIGDMLYWSGTQWTMIPIGIPGQYLQVSASNIPYWGSATVTGGAILTTTVASTITGISASSGGNITNDGGSPVFMRGVCWNIATGPTIANSKTSDGSGTGVFVSSLTGLLPVTTYYVRAYAINSNVVSYGNEISFTTTGVLPTLAATTAATAITATTATSGGNVTANGGSPILERGICYAITANPTTANTKVIDAAPGVGIFASNLTGLIPGTLYYVRSYAINSTGTAYGTQISFSTLMLPPTVVTTAAITITSTSAITGGSYTLNGIGGNLWNYGVAYATTPGSLTPTYVQTGTLPIPSPWTTNLTGLLGSTTYYIRAYIQGYWNGAGAYDFGNELSFTTPAPSAPVVASTNAITNITTSSALSGGVITSDGGAPITAKGVCYGITTSPTIAGPHTSDGTGSTNFVSSITGLLPSTVYFVRAYATNSVGTSYGPVSVSFTTCATPIYNVGDLVGGGVVFYVDCSGQNGLIAAPDDQGTAIPWGCSGTVTGATGTALFTGAANTTAILLACSTPGIAAQLCHAYNGGGYTDWYLPSSGELQEMYNQRNVIGNLTSGLFTYWSSTEGSATVASGWFVYGGYSQSAVKGYGTQMCCRAIRAFHGPNVPTVTTDPITNITNTTATSGGNVTNSGGANITARGVCWSTSTGPTIALPTKTNDGTGTGTFVSSITGLTNGNTYYVRAYATNSVGTSYGNEVTFVATSLPVVTTNPMGSLVGAISASYGTVEAEGASPVTAFGIVWRATANPTIANHLGIVTNNSVVTGATPYPYTGTITGLTIGSTYHVRAYATNGSGTAYGADVSFVATAATLGQSVTIDNITSVVFSINGTGLHGLIADLYGWGTSDWGCDATATGANATAIGTGFANTNTIIASNVFYACVSASPIATFAASVAQFDGPDWYLPSKDEMTLLWTNKGVDPTLDLNVTSAQGVAPFWSSSEVDLNNAWNFDGTTWFSVGPKSTQNSIWAIRSF
jgi:hypothetical protein